MWCIRVTIKCSHSVVKGSSPLMCRSWVCRRLRLLKTCALLYDLLPLHLTYDVLQPYTPTVPAHKRVLQYVSVVFE